MGLKYPSKLKMLPNYDNGLRFRRFLDRCRTLILGPRFPVGEAHLKLQEAPGLRSYGS